MDYKSTLMWKELNESKIILNTLREKNVKTLTEIAASIKKEKISYAYTAARGTSDHAMIFLKYLLESKLGIPVASGAPSAVTMYGAKMNFKKGLAIGCSQSGKAADVMEIIKAGNESGAVTVVITNDEESPLAKMAQYHLYCNAGEEKSVAATKTFCSQLYLSILLGEALGAEIKADGIGNLLDKATLAIDAMTSAMAKEFIGVEECFILSRGLTSALAFELGLKLQETCYIRARAYHSSDFYHGPMAMVGKGTKVILFASNHSLTPDTDATHRENYVECAKKMEELGADLFVITDDGESFRGMNAHIKLVPGGNSELETSFCFALAAQMLACKVSCGKGLSPDKPKALKKVTITR